MSADPESDRHVRGRPPKANPRNMMVKVAFTDAEYQWVSERALAHDISLSDYCRRKVLGRTVPFAEQGSSQNVTASSEFSDEAVRRITAAVQKTESFPTTAPPMA